MNHITSKERLLFSLKSKNDEQKGRIYVLFASHCIRKFLVTLERLEDSYPNSLYHTFWLQNTRILNQSVKRTFRRACCGIKKDRTESSKPDLQKKGFKLVKLDGFFMSRISGVI